MSDERSTAAPLLAQTKAFRDLSAEVIAAFAERCRTRVLHTGETLFHQGDTVQALYVVGVGRLRAYAGAGATEQALGEIGALETIGEIVMLAGERHTATVRAMRDSAILSLDREALMELLRQYPEALLKISQVVVARLLERLRKPDPGPPGPRTLCLLPATPGVDVRALGEQLRACYGQLGPVCLLDAATVDAALGPGMARSRFDDAANNARLVRWLSAQEGEYAYLIYLADDQPGPWSRRCMRQADRILVVASEGSGSARQTPMLRLLAETDVEAVVSVALQWPKGPLGSSEPLGWRQAAGAEAHYFLRNAQDVPALARSLVGQAVGFVLGGGGARGFAHLGLLRAARELGIPIDLIGGTSMGAFIGALHAEGRTVEEITELMRETFVQRNFLNDYVLPRVALLRTRKFRQRLGAIFGERRLEHLATPYFCVSTSLTRGVAVVHESGRLRDWVGTSMAVPGIAPPMVWNEELLADGAVVNSLPADVMRQLGRGAVIACDVSSDTALRAEGVSGPDFDALFHWSGQSPRPGLFDILLRSATLSSVSSSRGRAAHADCLIRMPTAGIGLFQWKALDRLLDSAYLHALVELEAFKPRLPPLARA